MDRDDVTNGADELSKADLAEGYRHMAADREQEMEAEEWTEGLISDVE